MDIPKGSVKADLVFKSTKEKEIALTFLPPLVKKYEAAPVYFIITGGGWTSESREGMLGFSARSVEALRKEGFAVVANDYRVAPEGVVMKDIITDCFDALRYLARYADVLEIDKNRIALSGHSAGGHLCLMCAYAPPEEFPGIYDDTFTVTAAAPMSPATVMWDDGTSNLRDLARVYGEGDGKEERERTSPITYVTESCPPTLLSAGTSDYIIFAISSERLYKLLQEKGVPCELMLSVGGGHCFEKIHEELEPSISMEEVQDAITAFMLKHA